MRGGGSADWLNPHGSAAVPVLHAAMQRYLGLHFDMGLHW